MTKPILATVKVDNTKMVLSSVVRGVSPDSSFKAFKSIDLTIEECLVSDAQVGTLFIEFGFPMDELNKAMEILRQNPDKKPEKVILLVGEANSNESVISEYLSLGFSGILSKPFSEESLAEVFKVSERLSVEGSIARLKVVTGLQIKSMLEQKGEKFEGSSVLAAVKNACKKFEKDNPGETVESIVNEFSKMDPKDRMGRNVKDLYRGVSKRVKKLVDGK